MWGGDDAWWLRAFNERIVECTMSRRYRNHGSRQDVIDQIHRFDGYRHRGGLPVYLDEDGIPRYDRYTDAFYHMREPHEPESPPDLNSEAYLHFKEDVLRRKNGLSPKPASKLLGDRELGKTSFGMPSIARRTQIMENFIPVYFRRYVDQIGHCRIYNGKFSEDGSLFVSAAQDHYIRIYKTNQFEDEPWTLHQSILASNVNWTITDTDISPNQRYIVHSSLNNYVDMVDIENPHLFHKTLDFLTGRLYGLRFSNDGSEIIAGGCDRTYGKIKVYDLESNCVRLNLNGHRDDVNSVCFLDGSGDLLISGSDDRLCKLWDRRDLSSGRSCGVFEGHMTEITHVSSRGDGRYFISNSKGQDSSSIKLWDIRKLQSQEPVEQTSGNARFLRPNRGLRRSMSRDDSVMTYSGHQVVETLVRCHFSPMETTAQQYIYTGSSDGSVVIYDVLTGEVVSKLRGHYGPVRDVSWHPQLPLLCSTSWDGIIALWGPKKKSPPGDKIYTDFMLNCEP